MFESFKLTNWVLVRENCDINYRINTSDEVDIVLGDRSASFELCLDAASLREFVRLGNKALLEMDRLGVDEAADVDDPVATTAPAVSLEADAR